MVSSIAWIHMCRADLCPEMHSSNTKLSYERALCEPSRLCGLEAKDGPTHNLRLTTGVRQRPRSYSCTARPSRAVMPLGRWQTVSFRSLHIPSIVMVAVTCLHEVIIPKCHRMRCRFTTIPVMRRSGLWPPWPALCGTATTSVDNISRMGSPSRIKRSRRWLSVTDQCHIVGRVRWNCATEMLRTVAAHVSNTAVDLR